MKHVATLLFLLFATSAFAQKTSWDKFDFMLGTQIGMPLIQADSAVRANSPKAASHPIQPEDIDIRYYGGLYNGFPTETIYIQFSGNGLNGFNVSFKTKFLKKDFEAIKKVFKSKYGVPAFNDPQSSTWYLDASKHFSFTVALSAQKTIVIRLEDETKR